jgi:hydrogenase small subunit
MRWNNGVSFPIQSGHGCFGCSEESFWDNGPIYERMATAGGFGIEANADTVGKIALGVTATGLAAHAIVTNLRKHKIVEDLVAEGKKSEQELKAD